MVVNRCLYLLLMADAMFIFELVIALLLIGAVLSLLATRIGARYAALLALAGAGLALTPGMPTVTLDADSSTASAVLRAQYEARLGSGDAASPSGERAVSTSTHHERLAAAQRYTLADPRARNVIGDDAFDAAEEELDLLELTSDPRLRPM